MSGIQFLRAWEELSSIQRETAEWGEGPLLVLAGPGSGKTRVLTCRIARLLDSTREKNFRILALTFTNKAADEMRSRVAQLVPGQEARLFLGTFHSFCADLLRQHGTHLGISPTFAIYSQDTDLQAVLDDAVREASRGSELIGDRDRKLLPVIQRLKSFLVPARDCRGVFREPGLGERVALVYEAYEAELAKRNALDFNSLILRTHELLSTFPAFAKRYRVVYPYICIDEFQDTNEAQYKLVRALTASDHRNVFVVADDDQIIYQWNGASHKRIEEFVNDYAPAVIQLPMNYRCPPEIVNLANSLISHNFFRATEKRPLEASRAPEAAGATVRLLPAFPDFEAEAAGVARDIKRLHAGQLDGVVVLARNRKLLMGVEEALRREGLPAIIAQRKDEFESTPFVWLHAVLRLANDRESRKQLEAVCGAFAQLVGVEVDPEVVITQARASNRDYLQQWVRLARGETSDPSAAKALEQTRTFLAEGRDFRGFIRVTVAWFEDLARGWRGGEGEGGSEGVSRYPEERVVWEELTREITQSLGEELSLEGFLQELQMHSKEPPPKRNTAVLMTIHGAKGKEFDYVYLVGLVEDELPSFQSRQKGESSPEMEEERRNCFVAITRTIKALTLSYAAKYRGWSRQPSRFLAEMGLISR